MKVHKRILIITIIVTLLATITTAHPGEYQELVLRNDIEGEINIQKESPEASVSSVQATLYLKPLESYRQKVSDSHTQPDGNETEENMTFSWNNPTTEQLQFSHSTRVETTAHPKQVTSKTRFPLEKIPSEITPYLDTTENIDSSEEIKRIATRLAQGEDDLYIVEAKLASWVHDNVEYNLTTLTSEVNQPASWVMESRYGVCDEITNLFISMNRALGIPARFVSGVAYSEAIPDEDNWGNHGWAEVYYPGTGWVPYDVTYNQLGFLDASHIELQKGVDGNKPSIRYQHQGKDIDIKTLPLEFTTRQVSGNGEGEERSTAEIKVLKNEVGFGSYNLITASLENPNDYYITEEVSLHPTKDMIIDTRPRTKLVTLQPGEEKRINWIVHTKEDMDREYQYTFPVVISRALRTNNKTSFEVSRQGEVYSKAYMEQYTTTEAEQGTEEKDVQLSCSMEEQTVLTGTKQTIKCSAHTSPSEYPVSICYQGDCQKVEDNDEVATITFEAGEPKITTATITAQSSDKQIINNEYVTYTIVDVPKIELADLNITRTVKATENMTISFELIKKSVATPRNVTATISHPLFSHEWQVKEFQEDRKFMLEIPGSRLTPEDNTFTVRVTYKTDEQKEASITENLTTTLITENFTQRLSAMSNRIDVSVKKAFEKVLPEQANKIPLPAQRMITYILMLGVVLMVIGLITAHKKNIREDSDDKE
ncbi:MAG: transglutaminase-like domain-containing protein [Candidatus Woesearchaeota archaeon]